MLSESFRYLLSDADKFFIECIVWETCCVSLLNHAAQIGSVNFFTFLQRTSHAAPQPGKEVSFFYPFLNSGCPSASCFQKQVLAQVRSSMSGEFFDPCEISEWALHSYISLPSNHLFEALQQPPRCQPMPSTLSQSP